MLDKNVNNLRLCMEKKQNNLIKISKKNKKTKICGKAKGQMPPIKG